MDTRSPILVVVHPGSACGSANYNIGFDAAHAARTEMATLLNDWNGGIIVLDGELSDELPRFPMFANAIHSAVRRARRAGEVALREMADDPGQVDAIRAIAAVHDLSQSRVLVTGAWYDPSDKSGCVNSVIRALDDMGVRAVVADAVCAETDAEALMVGDARRAAQSHRLRAF